MHTINVNYLSKLPHVSQIITGFYYLGQTENCEIMFNDATKTYDDAVACPAAVEVVYKRKNIIYDLDDGYQHIDGMRRLLSNCDFYFKRSFSAEKNQQFLSDYSDKMYPLGFNYYVSYKGNPINPPLSAREVVKKLLGIKTASFFTPEIFENSTITQNSKPCILFYTRLWSNESALPDHLNEERDYINATRIEIIRRLRSMYGKNFWGGVQYSALAQSMCPDLILSPSQTIKSAYIKKLHRSDICIGSMGLHESIGWKTGEYVAASKAIVNERFRYTVPGDFSERENYLSFSTVEECLSAVEKLASNPLLCEEMKNNNFNYYYQFLKPEALVRNTLNIVDRKVDNFVMQL